MLLAEMNPQVVYGELRHNVDSFAAIVLAVYMMIHSSHWPRHQQSPIACLFSSFGSDGRRRWTVSSQICDCSFGHKVSQRKIVNHIFDLLDIVLDAVAPSPE